MYGRRQGVVRWRGMTPEQEARVNIDRLLEQAGWSVQNADSINLCICSEWDSVVDSFLGRPLDGGPYPYLWLNALTQKVREDGRIVNVSVAVATGVNRDGKREVLGIDVGTSEDGAFWLAFLRSLAARGLGGVGLVTSDAHQGLKDAIATVFAGASWQRWRTHFMTNCSLGSPAAPSRGWGPSTSSRRPRRFTRSTRAWWGCSTSASPRLRSCWPT